jgi:transcriptional regulator with XRE-family HTH domain
MPSPLGEYLATRRARIGPAAVGLPSSGLRRVPGLRREEVALLGGVSVDYYVRLEQGRERRPSAQVLDALAAALQLTADERAHLFAVAGVQAPVRAAVLDRVDPALRQLMDAWPDNPALVYNRANDVLAANSLAEVLFDGASRNLLEFVFGDPAARSLYADWSLVAANAVAGFRLSHGEAPDDPRLRAVLTGLLASSAEFRELWAAHEARAKSLERKRFQHPSVGALTLTMQTFDVRSAPGQQLVVYHAEPGSESAAALRLLGTLAATC